jgi:hypothetical protein
VRLEDMQDQKTRDGHDWRAVAAATGPADRAAAEEGVRLAYRTAGLAQPERIVWADSPKAAVEAVEKLADAGRSVRQEVRTVPWAEERRRVHDELGPAGWAVRWSATGALLWDPTRALADRIRAGVADALTGRSEDGADLRRVLLDAVLGQHDAAWLSAFDGHGDRLAGLAQVARNAGWWWPYENAVVISERPVALHRDEAGRLHRVEGPALAYPDGFALYAWRGTPVPAGFLDELAGLTPSRIRDEKNAGLRRVMLEHYGYDRYLTESGAEPVHRDGTGALWRITLMDDEDVVLVEVVDPTPGPDGPHRTSWLRVPPTTRTAKEGVAWTFGPGEDAYAALRQT